MIIPAFSLAFLCYHTWEARFNYHYSILNKEKTLNQVWAIGKLSGLPWLRLEMWNLGLNALNPPTGTFEVPDAN